VAFLKTKNCGCANKNLELKSTSMPAKNFFLEKRWCGSKNIFMGTEFFFFTMLLSLI
jgi:hypothetical protein